MKKHILIVALIALSFQSCKSEVSYDQLPQNVKKNFTANIPDAKDVKWEENADYYFAHFTENGEKGIALFYKADGNWVETEKALSLNDLTPLQKESLIKRGQIRQLKELKKNDSTDVIKVEVSK
ncbi:PepSY-like domain-containing protein [Runella slithyformis]|uniref:Uncharacterized protein n=1 Tax=Runella slithyformis (strain ATCC 29530 / DSM 19594 / LMG 11500 / NCIMB 11436 / LSU 4) TaxID=761193 RepID=A0A7U4E6N2_RUNSL|nr:PepSY-like domain-containing protein [Runella slithyformis]AEI49781.1 hypothetical protein Runsl_3415 [Runella slithyformis DSM 19594]